MVVYSFNVQSTKLFGSISNFYDSVIESIIWMWPLYVLVCTCAHTTIATRRIRW